MMTTAEWQHEQNAHQAHVDAYYAHRRALRLKRQNANRRARNEAYRSLGLKRVRDTLGGTYWE